VLDRPLSRVTDVRHLSFIVAYDYSVAFTHDALSPDNCCLVEVLARRELDKRRRCAIFIDEGVLPAMPGLPQRITDYAVAHRQNIEFAGDWAIVVGSENCSVGVKNPVNAYGLKNLASTFAPPCTADSAAVPAAALPDGVHGSLSTVPGTFCGRAGSSARHRAAVVRSGRCYPLTRLFQASISGT